MSLDVPEIQDLAKQLVSNAALKLGYNEYKRIINKEHKLLIVEGATDEKFIKKIKNENVNCLVAGTIFTSNNSLRFESKDYVNCKYAIVSIITSISRFPSPFVKYPDELDKWDIYGLVDLDCEKLGDEPTPPKRLFITDTHDLETLLLSTDKHLFSKIEGCVISQDDIDKALFIAYQLAVIRKQLFQIQSDLDLRSISSGSSAVDFSAFVDDSNINVVNLMQYIKDNTAGVRSNPKINSITNKIRGAKSLKKRLDANGVWKQTVQEFNYAFPVDFWEVVNGHDILQLLVYINDDAKKAFGNSKINTIDRAFEMRLIAAYDYSQFSKTKLNNNMNKAGIIK